jgi:ParB family chromosome partitioning protein
VVLVRRDGRYLLLAGERRFLACRQLGLPAIPARVLDVVGDRAEILEIQMAENSLREDIDPIDLGNAMVEYFQARHDGLSFEQIFNAVIAYNVDPKRLEKAIEVTVTSLMKNSCKSPASLKNTLSLLKLPDEIREAVKTGRIGVSQGYIFAANLDNPGLTRIFNDALNKPVTNNALKMAFVTAAQADKAKKVKQPQPVQRLRNNIKSVRNLIELQVSKLAPKEMTDLLADMESLTQLIRQELDRQTNEASRISAEKEAKAEAAAQTAAASATAEPQAPPEPAPETTTPKKKKVLL